MGCYIGPVCRLCRREGVKLFLKGPRCFTGKCAIERRGYPPGQHGQARSRMTDYSLQIREKQKLKRIYGLLDRQFRRHFERAAQKRGITGENLLQILECRLDNVVYRLGFASSRREARQLLGHGHFILSGKTVTIPSLVVKEGNVIEVKEKSKQMVAIGRALSQIETRGIPQWLELDREGMRGRVKALPTKDDISLPVAEQVIVEFYSR